MTNILFIFIWVILILILISIILYKPYRTVTLYQTNSSNGNLMSFTQNGIYHEMSDGNPNPFLINGLPNGDIRITFFTPPSSLSIYDRVKLETESKYRMFIEPGFNTLIYSKPTNSKIELKLYGNNRDLTSAEMQPILRIKEVLLYYQV